MSRPTRRNFQAPDIWPIESIVLTNPPLIIEQEAEANFVAFFQDLETTMIMTSTKEWKTNPFHGNFNPGTKTGQQIFLEKTKGNADGTRYSLTKDNAANLHQFFKSRAASLGKCIQIPNEFNADGSVKSHANLISQHLKVELKDVQHTAHKRFATALPATDPIPPSPFTAQSIDPTNVANDKEVVYDHVNTSVLAKLIETVLTTLGFQDLLLQKDLFMFTDQASGEVHFDGPTMLKLILTQVNPDTIIGMDQLKAQLETMKLHEHGNDVAKMLTSMQSIFNTLKENGHEPDSYHRYIYTTLISGPNANFNAFMQRIIDNIQSGNSYHKDISADNLIVTARTKYNNTIADKSWGKVDPRDAKIMALTTALEEIRTAAPTNSGKSVNATDAGVKNKFAALEEWRKKFDGDEKVVSGRTFYWCKHHKGKDYDSLYVSSHCPAQHDAWSKDKRASRNDRCLPKDATRNSAKSDAGNSASNKSKLGLTDKLKQVLMTNACMSKEDVEKLYQLAQEN